MTDENYTANKIRDLLDDARVLREALDRAEEMIRGEGGRPTLRDRRVVAAAVRSCCESIAGALAPGGLVYDEVTLANERDAGRVKGRVDAGK